VPASHFRGVVIDDAIAHGLFQNANEYRQVVLNSRPAASVRYPAVNSAIDNAIADHPDRKMAQGWNDALMTAIQA
jgi:hypothetical protein